MKIHGRPIHPFLLKILIVCSLAIGVLVGVGVWKYLTGRSPEFSLSAFLLLMVAVAVMVFAWLARSGANKPKQIRPSRPKQPEHQPSPKPAGRGYAQATDDQLRQQFTTISEWVSHANTPDERQQVMELVRLNYPQFQEAARHFLTTGESLDTIEKTTSKKQLEDSAEIARKSQTAMFNALPFAVDLSTRAKQEGSLSDLISEARAHLKSAPAPAPQAWQTTLGAGFHEIDRLVSVGDWDSARVALQHIAYDMPKADPQTKADFTAAMCQFAVRDPLFQSVMEAITPLVLQTPGIRQAQIYAGWAPEKKELVRYVLYYAAESGQLVRVKKGNSYQLYPKGFTPPAKQST